jgi:hypothetical protein
MSHHGVIHAPSCRSSLRLKGPLNRARPQRWGRSINNSALQLVSFRYERTSADLRRQQAGRPRGEVFGGDVAVAMIDGLVHHPEVITLKDKETATASQTATSAAPPAASTTED